MIAVPHIADDENLELVRGKLNSAFTEGYCGKAISILRYIPSAEHEGIFEKTSTYNVYDHILEALEEIPLTGVGSIYFPYGKYICNSTINLKRQVKLLGDNSGSQNKDWATIIKFPADTPGIIVNRGDTLGFELETPPSTGRADGAVISGLGLVGGGGSGSAHGIHLRARATIENALVEGFSGNGIHVVAHATSEDPVTRGNANLFHVYRTLTRFNGGDGLHASGPDANAGVIIGLDATENAGWGVYDESFLGNTYVGCHTASNAGAYKTTRATARHVLLGCYSELDQAASEFGGATLVIGGLIGPAVDGMLPAFVNASGGKAVLGACVAADGRELGHVAVECVGSPGNGDIFRIYQYAEGEDPFGMWRLRYLTPGETQDLVFNFQNASVYTPFRMTGSDTTFTGGRSEPVPGALVVPRLYIGAVGSLTDGRNVVYASAAPTTGLWARGDRIYNLNPIPGGSEGWICTTGGTAGADAVFKTFGFIAS